MKAKRLTALALAALMTASGTSVAFASERVDYDLDFARDGYYKYNEDTDRLELVDRDEFQPGDDVYIRLVEDSDEKFSNKKTYDAYADWEIGGKWVDDVDIVYRKGDIIRTTNYDWRFTFDGTVYTGTGAAKNDDATKQSLIDSKLTDAVKASYKEKHWDIATGYNVDGKFYANADAAAKAEGFEKRAESVDGQYTYNGQTGTLDELNLTNIPESGYIYNNTYDSTTDPLQVLKTVASKDSINNRFDTPAEVYVDNNATNYGVVIVNPEDPDTQDKKTVYTVEKDGVIYWWDENHAEDLLLNKLGVQKAKPSYGYYINKGDKLGTVVASNEVQEASGIEEAWYSNARISYKTAQDALASRGIKSEPLYIVKGGDKNSDGDLEVVNADVQLDNAITAAKNSFTFTARTNTESRWEYWVKISTKESTTTKDIDIVGDISVGTNRTNARNEDELSVDITLTNANTDNGDYFDEVDGDITIEDGERAVVSFADDAGELIVEFGDDAWFEFNARGQGKLNLAYNTKFNRDFAYDYDHANIDFINFVAEPTTNKTGTLYIYADEDSYIYEVTSKGAKKINGAYYDDDEGAWVIRTRHLTSYAISDRRLKTIDQMEDDKNSSSSSKPSGSQGSGSGNGNYKPIPDTGR